MVMRNTLLILKYSAASLTIWQKIQCETQQPLATKILGKLSAGLWRCFQELVVLSPKDAMFAYQSFV